MTGQDGQAVKDWLAGHDISGSVCVGWRFAPALADPGPAPSRPAAPPAVRLDPGWIAAQRRISHLAGRPARLGLAACCAGGCLSGVAWVTGLTSASLAGACLLATAAGAARCALAAAEGRRRRTSTVTAERDRVAAVGAAREENLRAVHLAHASDYRAWQRRLAVFERQPAWFAVSLPAGIDRVDVAGGTLAGWSAMLTMIAAPRLSAGGEVTVIDLTEGAVAGDLIALARRAGVRPLVWVLPEDLPRLDLGTGLESDALADVLALAAGAAADVDQAGGRSPERAGVDLAADCALIERVLGALGPDPALAQVTAALRLLADIGGSSVDLRSGLISAGQAERIGRLFGRSASERIVAERAFVLESRLRRLDWLGASPEQAVPTRLRVAALDRRRGVIGNRMISTYLVAALTHLLRQAEPGEPWAHTLCLLGAERLGGDLLDRLTSACETSRAGLVLAFRTLPSGVRERLGRGNAAIAFMRLGNGDEARAASELIGTEHRLVLGQLTDTVGTSVTDTSGESYTSTTGTTDSAADSYSVSQSTGRSRGRGHSRPAGFGPFGGFNSSSSKDASFSLTEAGSLSLSEGISESTSWGVSTSRALGGSESRARTAQRSREFLVEADELQRLPASAMIVSYPAPAGRTVLLADANPAIMTVAGARLSQS